MSTRPIEGAPLADRVLDARPEVDRFVAAVLAARASEALFGVVRPVAVGRYHLRRVLGAGGGGAVFVAHDPELDRELAIKLIVADTADQRARALAEGQALARLAHPNVVAVFDVGVVDDRVYLAMELVAGQPLRRYATAASPRAIVRAYRQAGAGLAAAHAAGLVHGDFKPDNAVIGADQRVRVVDFGLAGAVGADLGGGTPAYMAPECVDGAAIAPSIDQYAFAIALREALAAAGWATLPRWLAPIVARGSAARAADRYPTLAAMLAALDADPSRRRRWYVAPVAFAVSGFLLASPERPVSGPRCDDVLAALGPAWSSARRERVTAHLRDLGTDFARATAATAPAALDAYAAAWGQVHIEACHARDHELPALATRRAGCLAGARARLGAVAELFEGAAADEVAAAVRAASELPALDRCQGDQLDLDAVEPPPLAQAPAIAAATEALDRAAARVIAARPDAIAATAAVVAAARDLAYPPLVAAALLWHGRALYDAGRAHDARAPLFEAVELAIAARADAIAVEAYARALLIAIGADTAGARGGLLPIAALATRLGVRDRFAVALLHNHAGVVERAAGELPAARAAWSRALELARGVDGPGAVELAWVRTNLASVTDEPAVQAALHAEALGLARARLGADHPLTLDLEMAAAFAAPTAEAARQALRGPCTRAAELHPDRGPAVVVCAYELAILDLAAGDRVDARASLALVARPNLAGQLDGERRTIAAALAEVLDDTPGAAARLAALAHARRPTATTPWYELLLIADLELGLALAGDPAAAARAVALLAPAAAAQSSPSLARRLAWARALAGS
jgi:hypothetical protein